MSTVQRRRRINSSWSRRPTKRSRGTSMPPRSGPDSSRHNGSVVVDLTCEALDPPVVDLTTSDSVVLVDERSQGDHGASSESYVLSSGEEDEMTFPSRAAFLSALESNNRARSTPGTISCPICLETYGEIVANGRLVVSTKCGHLFCSQCLRDSLLESHTCPTCRKRLTNKQYHPIYI
ncbi:RING finger protein 4 [Brienomyrus brachyistius]|uniref:RING finger protein 4 n=1 Tax=Brienomyrus brachyistius TaxID=42636 RepID=UPI0020B24A87|nr:RING finger protein 4 [Brienomyrus brachyistius]XP_048827585.1 RING finger protein 4 [Brienomyrus brachyistius]